MPRRSSTSTPLNRAWCISNMPASVSTRSIRRAIPIFSAKPCGALSAVETAVIVINAHSGIQVNTRRVYQEAEKLGLARVVVINKMDEHNVDYARLMEEIRELWGQSCTPLNVPLGQEANFKGVVSTLEPPATFAGAMMNPAELHDQLVETIVQVDEAALERYFEGETPQADRLGELHVHGDWPGSIDAHCLLLGQDRRWPGRAARCIGDLLAFTRRRQAAQGNQRRQGTRNRRPMRMVRWWAGCSKRGSTPSCRS